MGKDAYILALFERLSAMESRLSARETQLQKDNHNSSKPPFIRWFALLSNVTQTILQRKNDRASWLSGGILDTGLPVGRANEIKAAYFALIEKGMTINPQQSPPEINLSNGEALNNLPSQIC